MDNICGNTGCVNWCLDEYDNSCIVNTHVTECEDYEPKLKTKKIGENDMDEFDRARAGHFTKKHTDLVESVKTMAKRTKTTTIRVKVGKLAIAAVKASLKKTPGIPDIAKVYIDSDYADIVIGAVAPLIVPFVTDNAKVNRVAEDMNIASGVMIAEKLSFIDNFVMNIVAKVGEISDISEEEK